LLVVELLLFTDVILLETVDEVSYIEEFID
jgi:hypothetical protein